MGPVTWAGGAPPRSPWRLMLADSDRPGGEKPANPVWFIIWTRKRAGDSDLTSQGRQPEPPQGRGGADLAELRWAGLLIGDPLVGHAALGLKGYSGYRGDNRETQPLEHRDGLRGEEVKGQRPNRTKWPTFCLVLVLVRQMVRSGPGDQLHVGCCEHLKEEETIYLFTNMNKWIIIIIMFSGKSAIYS